MADGKNKTLRMDWGGWLPIVCILTAAALVPEIALGETGDHVDYNRTVRRILADNCFKCHGADPQGRKGGKHGMRLDTPEGSQTDLGGYRAIVPGHPEKSELVRRITTSDSDDKMPPPQSGKKLSPEEIAVLQKWIAQGAEYARHWAYVKPSRPALPSVKDRAWLKNAIDHFILARLEHEGLQPAPEADRHTLIRRVSLDLTGLPPTPTEVDQFAHDTDPRAYERLVDRLLASSAFGEHWARWWLDQARYADSAGYADDPPRTIWAYRDYVVRAFNANKPFDQFTLEQLAGDLLPEPTEDQLIATGFHRNTLTNNEGGTSDEEFRNVAVVDRVNTTLAVWMGTTMGCAQCHDHKYDPITQNDYFRSFAIFNNTADADRGDESPVLPLYTQAQKEQRQQWEHDIAQLERALQTSTPALAAAQEQWELGFASDLEWQVLHPDHLCSKAGAAMTQDEDGVIQVARGGKTDVYTLRIPLVEDRTITGLRLEALPADSLPGKGPGYADGNFVISRIHATFVPPAGTQPEGRFVRIEIPGKEKILSLAEVQVFQGTNNLARKGAARQSSTAYDGRASRAIDGNTNGHYFDAKSTTHTEISDNPWWEVDLGSLLPVDSIVVWNRTDGQVQERLSNFRLSLLNDKREPVWQQEVKQAPSPNSAFPVIGARAIVFVTANADDPLRQAEAAHVLDNEDLQQQGWSAGTAYGKPHSLTLIPGSPLEAPTGSHLTVMIEQLSKIEYATIGRLRLSATADPQAGLFASTPPPILAILKTPPDQRTETQRDELARHYRSIAPALQAQRDQLAHRQKQLDELKPYTTVPIMRELAGNERRTTHIQHRGNFLDVGKEVITPGLPSAFAPLSDCAAPNRLDLARWLVSENNPLTARVLVNRFWESIFGIGIVRTSEDFGTQGELPSNPELLDWLATELQQRHWDVKYLLKLMVTSAAYRQSSRVTPELLARDPDNRLLARGPRFRLSAEMIRDQALFVSGLLSRKMYGPPVRPPQPKLGLSAAFGGGIDWTTSTGEDRYRRALYTTWRRSNPYPSMATFDAPNREVCVVRRPCSNTPLQALVTLNDPVYIEAAQALARRMASAGSTPTEKAQSGFRLCLARPPSALELKGLLQLYGSAYARFAGDADKAREVAGMAPDSVPPGSDVAELATWTVVGNVLLNLDEMLMKP